MCLKPWGAALAALALAAGPVPARAAADQDPIDKSDPSVVEEELRQERREAPSTSPILEAPRGRAAQSSIGEPVLVGAIRIDGAETMSPAAFADVIERYAGRTLSPAELTSLASDVAARVRDAGYGLATAWIPQQRIVSGVLRVMVDEGRIDAVEVTGSAAAAVEPYLRHVADGGPVKTRYLERQLLLADDVPGVRLGKAKLQRRDGRNILVVAAVRDRVEMRAGFDNWGSATAGPLRARFNIDVNGVVAAADRFSVDALLTPSSPKEFALMRALYSMAVDESGSEINFGGYVARSEAGGVLADLDIDGWSTEIEAGARHPIVRSRSHSLWAGIVANMRESRQTLRDAPLREDKLTTLTASLYGTRTLPQGRVRGRAAVVQGLDLFGATRSNDLLSSRRDADATFRKFELWGEYDQRLGGGFSFFAQAEAQVASGPLLSSEEMGLGGRYFGRAWDYREFSGDRGVAGAAELRFDMKKPSPRVQYAQFYAYADAGAVRNYRLGTGGGSLASAGAGIRLWLRSGFKASAEIGVPISDGATPFKRDKPRFSFTVEKSF